MGNKSLKKDMSATTEFKLKRQKKKKLAGWQKFLIVFFSLICLVALAVLAVFTYFKYIHKPHSDILPDNLPTNTDNVGDISGNNSSTDDKNEQEYTLKDSRYNFLVIGCDREQWLSDVIMIATYDIKDKSVSIMQIPRDTYVTVNNELILDENGNISFENFDGKNDYGCKINAVLGHGGNFAASELRRIASLAKDASDADIKKICSESFLDIDKDELKNYMNSSGSAKSQLEYDIKLKFAIRYLSALLSRSFGTPIDFYVQMNLDGFVNIVDAIGGVDVYVQEDMHYDDPLQDLHIHINKGYQHLDGKDAEGFIRFRYGYYAADIARIDAQKIFMTAFIKKVLSLEGIMNLSDLIKEVSANLTTNLSFSDALYFATNALDIDLSKVVMLTMPGSAKTLNGISYYSIDKATMMEYVNTYLNKYEQPLSEEHFFAIEIASGNSSTPPLTAEDITENQPDLGFIRQNSSSSSSAANSQSSSVSEQNSADTSAQTDDESDSLSSADTTNESSGETASVVSETENTPPAEASESDGDSSSDSGSAVTENSVQQGADNEQTGTTSTDENISAVPSENAA